MLGLMLVLGLDVNVRFRGIQIHAYLIFTITCETPGYEKIRVRNICKPRRHTVDICVSAIMFVRRTHNSSTARIHLLQIAKGYAHTDTLRAGTNHPEPLPRLGGGVHGDGNKRAPSRGKRALLVVKGVKCRCKGRVTSERAR